jgi:hypothetical protein
MTELNSVANDKSVVWGWILIAMIGAAVLSGVTWKFRIHESSTIAASTGEATTRGAESPVTQGATPQQSPFATWIVKGLTVIGSAGTAPDGSNTVTKLVEDVNTGSRQISANLILDDLTKPVYTHVYAHKGENRRLLFFLENRGELVVRCDVDLDTGEARFESDTSFPEQGCEALPDNGGWWRVQLRGGFDPTFAKGPTLLSISPAREPFKRAYEGDGHSHIFIWGFGLDSEATGNTISQAGPFAGWKQRGVKIVGNAGAAPDGSNTASKLIEDTHTGPREITANLNLDDLTKPLFAHVYAHGGENRRLLFFLKARGQMVARCDVDLGTGKATFQADGAFPSQGCEAIAENGGWWRVQLRGGFDPSYANDEKLLGIAPTVESFKPAYDGDGHSHILILAAAIDRPDAHNAVPAFATRAAGFTDWRVEGAKLEDGMQAPDGTATGTKLIEDADSAPHRISAIINVDHSKPVSASLSAHAGSGRRLLFFISSGSRQINCDIDLISGQASMKVAGAAQPGNCAATAQGRGWWRADLTGLLGRESDSGDTILGIGTTAEPFTDSYQGDGNSHILIWNPAAGQLRHASMATEN